MAGKDLDKLHPGLSSGDSNKDLVKLGRQQAGQNESSGEFRSV